MMYAKGAGFIRDYTQRTLNNLKLIETRASENPNAACEVTELINSLMAMVVFPMERALAVNQNSGWSRILQKYTVLPGPMNGDDLMKNLRNAICHSHILFEAANQKNADGSVRIAKIIFVSCNYNGGKPSCPLDKNCDQCRLKQKSPKKPDFQIVIPVSELRQCVEDLANEIEKAANAVANKKGGVSNGEKSSS